MAQIVKLRRSAVSGQKPTNSNLQLGEIALNTTDGKAFMAVSGSGGPSVQEFVITNTVNTGSLGISGSINLIGDQVISGSAYITNNVTIGDVNNPSYLNLKAVISSSLIPDSDGVHHFVGTQFRRWQSVNAFTGSFSHIEGWSGQTVTIQNSVITGSFTGSFIGDGSNLTNVPFYVSGSSILNDQLGKTFNGIQFDHSSGLLVTESVDNKAIISIDPILSSSLNERIDVVTGSLDSINNFTSSVVLTSQTGSMTVLSASYAVTAAFALNSLGGGDSQGRTAIYEQTTPATGWTFNHYLGEKYPAITVFDSNGNVIVPSNINAVDDSTLTLTFTSPVSGVVSATVGGGLPSISQSFDGRVLAVVDGAPTWKTGLISGSSQLSNLGFATTGSNTFGGSQTINGDLIISDSIVKQITATGLTTNTNIIMLPTSSYNGGFFDYIVKDGTNFRAGNIMTIFNGNTVKFTETSTNDIGDTTPVTISVAQSNGNITLNTQISSGTWTIKVLSRGI